MSEEKKALYASLAQRLTTLQHARAQLQERLSQLTQAIQEAQAEFIALDGRIQEVSAILRDLAATPELPAPVPDEPATA